MFLATFQFLKKLSRTFEFDFAGYLCCQKRRYSKRAVVVMTFGSVVGLSGIVLAAIDPQPGHEPSTIGSPTDYSGQQVIGGVLLVVGVAVVIVGGILLCQLKKLKDSSPEHHVTFQQTTVAPSVNPLRTQQTQQAIHPTTPAVQNHEANFPQPGHVPTATNNAAQLDGMDPPPSYAETTQSIPAFYLAEAQQQSQCFASPAAPPSYEDCVGSCRMSEHCT